MDEAEASDVVPHDALRAAIVVRNLPANFFRDNNGFRHRIPTEEEGPGRKAVGPSGAGDRPARRDRGDALRDEGLLDEAGALVAPVCFLNLDKVWLKTLLHVYTTGGL